MQNPNNVHAVGAFQIEHNVTSDTVPSIPFTNLVARATSIGVVGNTFNRDPDGGEVGFSLASIPVFLRVIPDGREISLRGWGKAVNPHDF